MIYKPENRKEIDERWLSSDVLSLVAVIEQHYKKNKNSLDNTNRCDLFPILADALEDAGFSDIDILSHLRSHNSYQQHRGIGLCQTIHWLIDARDYFEKQHESHRCI